MYENIEMIPQDVRIIEQPVLKNIRNSEFVARLSHRSEERISDDSYVALMDKMTRLNHQAAFEFMDMTVMFTTNRGVSHELVRHRLCSFLQESTRYINFDKKMKGKIPIIRGDYPMYMLKILDDIAYTYKKMVNEGIPPQKARDILPMSLATRIAVKTNLREWAYLFHMRLFNKKAHPQFRELMSMLLNKLVNKPAWYPVVNCLLQNTYGYTEEQIEDARGVCLNE